MLNILTKEKLKRAGWFGLLSIASLSTGLFLGLDLLYVAYVALSLLNMPLQLLVRPLNLRKSLQVLQAEASLSKAQRRAAQQEGLWSNWRLVCVDLCMLSISWGVPMMAFWQTGNFLYSAFLFILPGLALSTNMFRKNASGFTLSYSSSRSLDLNNPKEVEFLNILKAYCEKTNTSLPKVKVIEIFQGVSNIAEFRTAAVPYFSKTILDIKDNKKFLETLKSVVNVNMIASQSIAEGNQINVFDTNFNHAIKLTSNEIEAIIGHESGHHAAKDSYKKGISLTLYWIGAILSVSSFRLIGLALFSIIHVAWIKLQKSKESNADLFSAQRLGAQGLISFFTKAQKFREENKIKYPPNAKNFLQRAEERYDKWAASHPCYKERIALLQAFDVQRNASRALDAQPKASGTPDVQLQVAPASGKRQLYPQPA